MVGLDIFLHTLPSTQSGCDNMMVEMSSICFHVDYVTAK